LGDFAPLRSLRDPANRGDVADLAKNTAEVQNLVARAVADRPAGLAIALAPTLVESEHIVDVDNPFPLAMHASVIIELEGGVAEFHARVMEALRVIAREVANTPKSLLPQLATIRASVRHAEGGKPPAPAKELVALNRAP
jgi:hypothetical protein